MADTLYYTPHGPVKVANSLVPLFESIWSGYSLNEKIHFRKCAAAKGSSMLLAEMSESGSSSLDEIVDRIEAKRCIGGLDITDARTEDIHTPEEGSDEGEDYRIEVEADEYSESGD